MADKIRIVIAEDHHVVRLAIATLLGKETDMEIVAEVGDGRSLVNIVGHHQPDVLLMDAQMPNHKPINAAKQIVQEYPQVKILVLSAYDLPEYVVGLLKSGVAGYVLKDDPSDMLVRAIRSVADGQNWVSPRVSAILIESVRDGRHALQTKLTNRELDVLRLVALGRKNDEIADTLVISEQTVKNHVTNIFRKLGVESRVEAVLYAISAELVPLQKIKDEY